jgi:hypothetical protein
MTNYELTTEEKMMHMFEVVHGKFSNNFEVTYVQHDDYDDKSPHEDSIIVSKNGSYCWSVTKSDLLFDYMTRNLNMWEIKYGEESQGGVSQ